MFCYYVGSFFVCVSRSFPSSLSLKQHHAPHTFFSPQQCHRRGPPSAPLFPAVWRARCHNHLWGVLQRSRAVTTAPARAEIPLLPLPLFILPSPSPSFAPVLLFPLLLRIILSPSYSFLSFLSFLSPYPCFSSPFNSPFFFLSLPSSSSFLLSILPLPLFLPLSSTLPPFFTYVWSVYPLLLQLLIGL